MCIVGYVRFLVPCPSSYLLFPVPWEPQSLISVLSCGSQPGRSPSHLASARALAQAMHKINAKLVYGGGTVGLMGEVARTLVSLSGPDSVHGIIPAALVKYEQAGRETGEPQAKPDRAVYGKTTVVNDMHTRKAQMTKEVLAGGPGSGFIALPGGYGTLEELAEVTTWNQLGIHNSAIVLLNVDGFYDDLCPKAMRASSAKLKMCRGLYKLCVNTKWLREGSSWTGRRRPSRKGTNTRPYWTPWDKLQELRASVD